ncbi:TRAP transporter substrate-binding protein [Microbacterium sp. A93]|uniref:TRAP transporter substrate-binding protein n=1 Tax=Microbacterium sp. A93 TaxID=3450716 RepID=UPI003F41FA8F
MRSKTRIAFLAATAITALALAGCSGTGGDNAGDSAGDGAATSPTVMKLALNQPETHPSYIALEAFGEQLKEATDGRWDIEVHANSTLGNQDEYLQSVSQGVIDLAIVSAPQLENLNKEFVLFSLPKVFDNIDHQMSVLDDQELVGDVYSSLEESNNISVVGGLTQGERSIYTKDGIVETPADLAGKKIRVQESPVFLAMIEVLGASPTPLPFGDVYSGLQSGVVDGAENNEISYFSNKHHEVAPYFSLTRHLVGADFLIINSDTLAEMSDEDRAAFDEGWTAAWKHHTELWKTDTKKAIADAEAGGAEFAEVDTEAFAEALEPLIDEFLTEDSQIALYEAIRSAAE